MQDTHSTAVTGMYFQISSSGKYPMQLYAMEMNIINFIIKACTVQSRVQYIRCHQVKWSIDVLVDSPESLRQRGSYTYILVMYVYIQYTTRTSVGG